MGNHFSGMMFLKFKKLIHSINFKKRKTKKRKKKMWHNHEKILMERKKDDC